MDDGDRWLVNHDFEMMMAMWDKLKHTTVGFTHDDIVGLLLKWMEIRLAKEEQE